MLVYLAAFGGFDLAFQRNGWKNVWYNDFDKYAIKTYNKNFGTNYEPMDITKVDATTIPKHTLLCAGFPCQSFSIAGKRKGFADTRGTMFFEICRIIKECRTPIVLLENVKGLLSHDEGRTFNTILKCLDELGYDAEWQVLNSKHFSVPQNRERVFIIANLRNQPKREVFPIKRSGEEVETMEHEKEKEIIYVQKSESEIARIYDIEGISPTLHLKTGGWQEPKILSYRNKTISELVPTLLGNSHNTVHKVVTEETPICISHSPRTGNPEKGGTGVLTSQEHAFTIDSTPHFVEQAQALQTDGMLRLGSSFGTNNPQSSRNIRRLTPLECERLQGFPDGWTEGVSDTQRYKQCGNAVTVNVIEEIAKRLNEVL